MLRLVSREKWLAANVDAEAGAARLVQMAQAAQAPVVIEPEEAEATAPQGAKPQVAKWMEASVVGDGKEEAARQALMARAAAQAQAVVSGAVVWVEEAVDLTRQAAVVSGAAVWVEEAAVLTPQAAAVNGVAEQVVTLGLAVAAVNGAADLVEMAPLAVAADSSQGIVPLISRFRKCKDASSGCSALTKSRRRA